MTISCEEEQKMCATTEYKKLDLSKLKNRKRKIMSTEDSLHDIVPIQWCDEVISGQFWATVKQKMV